MRRAKALPLTSELKKASKAIGLSDVGLVDEDFNTTCNSLSPDVMEILSRNCLRFLAKSLMDFQTIRHCRKDKDPDTHIGTSAYAQLCMCVCVCAHVSVCLRV